MNRNSFRHNKKAGDTRSPESKRYFWVAFILALLGNQVPFKLARLLMRGRHHFDLSLPIDAAIPFLPWTVCIYSFACLVFWFFLYRRVAALPRQSADRFFCANLLGKGFCFFFFIFLPTEMTRPELNGSSFWVLWTRFVYSLDEPNNLFPSLHCFIAWLCWAGIRRNREISALWRVSALLMAFAVCLSTLTMREHVMLDAAGGVLLSELCWQLAGCEKIRRVYSSVVDRILSRHTERQHPCSSC